jgi:hypothetical protein
MVNAPMPAAHAGGARLWRTKAVVDATTDRKVQPNSMHDSATTTGCVLSTGSSVATARMALSCASGRPPRWRCSRPAQIHDDATVHAPSSPKNAATRPGARPWSRSSVTMKVM